MITSMIVYFKYSKSTTNELFEFVSKILTIYIFNSSQGSALCGVVSTSDILQIFTINSFAYFCVRVHSITPLLS